MDNQLRKDYLEAMGITTWIIRQPEILQSEMPAAVAVTTAQPLLPAKSVIKQVSPTKPNTVLQPEIELPHSEEPPSWLTDVPPSDDEWYSSEIVSDESGQHAPRSAVADLDWDALRQYIAACKVCELHRTRTQTVFGVGNQRADLLIIGEAPGADEDRQGEPFAGRAGKLLNAMLKAIGLERDQIYIANILKCRLPSSRDPHVEEILHCEPYLLRQIALVAPKVILAVGRISAQNLLKSTDAVGRLRGRVHHFGANNIPLVVTYHPAYLLRSPEQKAKSWQDLQQTLSLLQK